MAGAFITAGLGILGLLFPSKVSAFVSLTPDGLMGQSELRATYGGFFLGLGVMAIVLNSYTVYLVMGVAWVAAAAGRLISLLVDGNRQMKNVGGMAFEGIIGLLCLTVLISP